MLSKKIISVVFKSLILMEFVKIDWFLKSTTLQYAAYT